MFAKDLEYLLAECCGQSDVSPIDSADIAERFDSLRGYGRLPRGRENRAKRLNSTETAAAILGLVPSNPKWAGHAAVILSDLRPAGGPGASFHGAVNLSAAMERLLTDSAARQSFISVTLSVAESGINSNGFATLIYQTHEARSHVAVAPGALRVPANVEVHQYLRHDDIMPSASLVVGHGGHSTTMRALAHGIPLLIMPMHRILDQPMIGKAVAAVGAGRVLPKTATAEEIRRRKKNKALPPPTWRQCS